MHEYRKCLTQVDTIIECLEEENKKKIPREIKNGIKFFKDKKYNWNFDQTKPLTEQELDRKTIALLSYINMEYLLSDEQKSVMNEFHKLNKMRKT